MSGGEVTTSPDVFIDQGGDTFFRYTGDNYDVLAQVMDDHPMCDAHQRSEHHPDLIIFVTSIVGALSGAHITYIRELSPGDWLRVTHDGCIEEHTGDPTE